MNREFDAKQQQSTAALMETLQSTIQQTAQEMQQTIVRTVETNQKEQEKKGYEDTVRDHLRGFSRTIPSFLMAYGDETVTLANFDQIIPDKVFQEVTSITLEQFRFLRDGGPYINQATGQEEHFAGHLLDPVVFDDSVKEFLNLKVKLADYFDESRTEDIFDYIPPQKTNQIFTPKWVVKKMVDLLEQENRGCFDDPGKTFLDPYMKSGLYITEIVKRLYRSEKMRQAFPDDKPDWNISLPSRSMGLPRQRSSTALPSATFWALQRVTASPPTISVRPIRWNLPRRAPWKGNWIRFSEIEKTEYSIKPKAAVCMGADGRLFVLYDYENGRICQFSLHRSRTRWVRSGQLARSKSAEGAALCPSDMMLCVISYWVLSGAKRRQIQQLRCCVLPTKLLKRRDVYLKLTRHNGRAGTHGTYNPKHNDRSFNLANSEHIDPERAKGNIYWDCFHGFRSALDPQDLDDLAATFSEVEQQFYENRYSEFIEKQNERNAEIRQTERNRSIPDLLSSRKTCPEETIYQLGTKDDHASGEVLLAVVTEFIEEFKARFGDHVHVLDWALHLDESTPHIHERHVFDCENKHGEVAPQQEKALEALGFDLPDPDKPLSRRNNRKITFDAACRKMLFEIAKRHGLDLEEEAEYGNRKYLEKQDFVLAKQKEQLAAQQDRLDELTLKVSDMETLLDDVSAAAYDKAVEVVTDVVRTETRKEDMRMIEDTKKWVLSPERKAPQTTREYAAHRLDTVLDKFLKTMQTTTARLQEKLLKPEVRQKGKEQVKEKARDSVLQLLNRLQAEQAQNKLTAQPSTQEGHSEI